MPEAPTNKYDNGEISLSFSKALDLKGDVPKTISYEELCSLLARKWAAIEKEAKAKK